MHKFTKSELAVLHDAADKESRGCTCCSHFAWHTGNRVMRSRSSSGQRELAAILKLRDRGLLTVVSADYHQGVPAGGHVTHYFQEITYRLGH